ncbi:MAG TPA: hypothetical protein VD978_08775 [Azospirillum sp.]|nr:hypothetical protein [Azospirillum sp.]
MLKKTAVVLLGVVLVSGCSDLSRRENRALTGAAVGAAGGAAIGGLTGGSAVLGGLIGGAGGAAVGALTADEGGRRKHR